MIDLEYRIMAQYPTPSSYVKCRCDERTYLYLRLLMCHDHAWAAYAADSLAGFHTSRPRLRGNVSLGKWQRPIYQSLKRGEVVFNPVTALGGRAASYFGRYKSSFSAVLARLEVEGYFVVQCVGPRGGFYSSWFKAYPVFKTADSPSAILGV